MYVAMSLPDELKKPSSILHVSIFTAYVLPIVALSGMRPSGCLATSPNDHAFVM